MNKSNPLGLLLNYGDSDEELEETSPIKNMPQVAQATPAALPSNYANHPASAAIHPPPISHCPWSACYDENSGFTYYWNQQTNAVTWEAPPEYLLALKLAQQHLTTSGNTEVSAEEWQLYQQALVEKQISNKIPKVTAKPSKNSLKNKDKKSSKKRPSSDSDDEYKIELITSYHNSDSESNDEQESPIKPVQASKPDPKPEPKPMPAKPVLKKQKTKQVEFGPTLPENQSYSTPIGPELPPGLVVEKSKSPETINEVKEQGTKSVLKVDEDSEEESELLKQLKDKAKLLEKLGGEIPTELQKIIKEDSSNTGSIKSTKDLDIDELLQEIEEKELPKIVKCDTFDKNSASNSPKPQIEDFKENWPALFPSAVNISKELNTLPSTEQAEEKKENIYLSNTTEQRKKLRISNSVLPKKHKIETPVYTTKYSQIIEGFSTERIGLGFNKDEVTESSTKGAINYGNGLLFTRGEVLNEKDEALDDMADLVEAKLKFLSQVQPSTLSPLQEMLVQMQTLVSAFRCGALTATYWRRWVQGAAQALSAHELQAAPAGWLCVFQRSEGRYSYKREADGFVQWEYPAVASTDMDICTTPPPPDTVEETPPPLVSPPRVSTPPPPSWHDPPPPGTDAHLPLPPAKPTFATESKKEIGDELMSFYNDLAELEKSNPSSATNSPDRKDKTEKEIVRKERKEESRYDRSEREKSLKPPKDEKSRKKSKVKISSSIGLKQKTVSSLVAKWQQVAEEINSD